MLIKTFFSTIREPNYADDKVADFIENNKKEYKYINTITTANNYYFYITVILEKKK
jgi:hypothetical protein